MKRSGLIPRKYICVFLFLFSVLSGGAQQLLTLKESIRLTIGQKPSQEVLRLEQRQAELSREEIKAQWWPEIDFSYNYRYNPVVATTIIPIGQFDVNNPTNAVRGIKMGTEWQQNTGISVKQPVLDISKIYQGRKSDLLIRLSHVNEKIGRDQLIAEVARTYLEICSKQELAAQAVQDTVRTRLTYEQQNLRFQQKKLLVSDLNRALINHNNSVNQLESILTDLFSEKVYLSFLTGLPVDSVLLKYCFDASAELIRMKSVLRQPFNPDSLPLLHKYDLQKEIDMQALKIRKSKSIPVISFDAFLGANQYTRSLSPFDKNSWYASSYLGLSLTIPILYGENLRSRNKRLSIDQTKSGLEREEQLNLYKHNALTAFHKIGNIEKQILRLEKNIELERQILLVLDKRLKEYQINAFEINQEETEYQKQLVELRIKYKEQIQEYLNYLENSGMLFILSE
ncbi:MAG: TolC family protein [Bacteroidales bacterium]